MRRLLAMLAGTLAVVAAPAAAAPAVGGPPQLLVIQVRSIEAGVNADDKPPRGLSKGDRLLERSPRERPQAVRQAAGALVGRDRALVILTSTRSGRVVGVATLPDGTIRFGGLIRLDAAESIPVTGGTGRYAKARGTLFVGDGDSPLNTYHLRLPAKDDGGAIV